MKGKMNINGVRRWRFPVVRLVLCVCLVAAALGGLTRPAQAAGIYTHTWFVDWAIEELNERAKNSPVDYSDLVDILNRHRDDVNYGAIFVDIGMTAGWPNDTVHYGGFQNAIIDCVAPYIEKGYRRTVTDETKIAFSFGIIAHQEADWPWHEKPNGLESNLVGTNELFIDYLLVGYDIHNNILKPVSFDKSLNEYAYNCANDAGIEPQSLEGLSAATELYKFNFAQIIIIGVNTDKNPELLDDVINHDPGGLVDGAHHIVDKWMKVWGNDQTPPTAHPTQSLKEIEWFRLIFFHGYINWNWSDDRAGIDPRNCTDSSYSNAEGILTASCEDYAGNKGSASYILDWTRPNAAPTQSPLENVYSRANRDATINWNWSDDGIGIDPANCTTSSTSNVEGMLTVSCKDLAGNTAYASFPVLLDVIGKLEERDAASSYYVKLDWKVSIVDLLILLGINSSYENRMSLAVELGCPPEKMVDSAQMNMWLHQIVLRKFAENGGNVPPELLDGN